MSQSNQPPTGGPPAGQGFKGTAIMPQFDQPGGAPPAAPPGADSTMLSSGQPGPGGPLPGGPLPGAVAGPGALPGAGGGPPGGVPGAQAAQQPPFGGPPPAGPPPGGAPPGGFPGGAPPGSPPGGFGSPPPGAPPGQGGFAPGGPGGFAPTANPYPPEDIESGKMLAVLGHIIGFVWIIPLVTRDNAFALYHAKQAAVNNIIVLAASVILTIIVVPTSFFTCGLSGVLYLGLFAVLYPWIMGLINAAQGKYEPMPWYGHLADQWFGGVQADKRPGALPPQGGQYPPGGQQ